MVYNIKLNKYEFHLPIPRSADKRGKRFHLAASRFFIRFPEPLCMKLSSGDIQE